ncbi:hypothetical protein GH714_008595 [Hevea brasiliensis]|uniref:Uncharacterized protein n=1 Tax=Hevea brasiliensis TaxID=3981 RepID=A0A6A6KYW7_HEVBR|nr:hypothetical protein GH714_008595 [Hevea brasiliensis]
MYLSARELLKLLDYVARLPNNTTDAGGVAEEAKGGVTWRDRKGGGGGLDLLLEGPLTEVGSGIVVYCIVYEMLLQAEP